MEVDVQLFAIIRRHFVLLQHRKEHIFPLTCVLAGTYLASTTQPLGESVHLSIICLTDGESFTNMLRNEDLKQVLKNFCQHLIAYTVPITHFRQI